MSDQKGKPELERPTVRPRKRETDDLPAPRLPSSPPLSEPPPKTEAISFDDLEEILPLLEDAEKGLDKIRAIEEANEPLRSGRPPDEPPRLLPTIGMFGSYAIVGRLALGGMAEILLAREESEGAGSRYLVVKRILAEFETDAAFVEMFLDEARVMMRLSHPNVTHVYKFGQQDGTHYIAMEWVHGASLGKLIRKARKSGGIPPQIACRIIASVAEALDHAHQAKGEDGQPLRMVHRDVTPDNIMVSYDGAVKLLDFGIARAATRGHKTQAGVVKGKFAYMAPEQCRAKDLDHRVDVFALGVCLYEALTGRPLYRRDTEFETMEAIVRGPIPTLAERVKNPPAELEAIIAKCLAKKPEDRFESAGEMQEAIDSWIASSGKVVTARKVKKVMDKLFAEEQRQGPTVDTTPFGSSFHMGSDAAAAAFFSMQGTEGGAALPEPRASEPGAFEANVTPPYAGDPSGDARSGISMPDLGAALGEPPAGSSPLLADSLGPTRHRPVRQPAPIAPGRAIRPAPAETANVWKWGVIGALALALAGGAAYLAIGKFLGGPEAPADVDTAAPILRGSVYAQSEPAGATVYVDEEERATTPALISDLMTGRHDIRFELEGHLPHSGTIEIRADQTLDVIQALVPAIAPDAGRGQTGRLTLTSTPIARVFLNGTELGRTPLRNVVVPAGLVALELETPDGQRHRRGVLVPANDRAASHIDLTH